MTLVERQQPPETGETLPEAVTDVAYSWWVEALARVGYAAKGVVYVVIGGLALLTALRSPSGETTDRAGVLQNIAQESYGWVLLGLITVGLIGYALWNVVRAIVDVDQRGSNLKGRLIRTAYLFVAGSYLFGAATAIRLLINANHPVEGDEVQTWTARLLNQPFGMWLVFGAAGVVGGVAIGQLYRAISANFARYLHIAPDDLVDHDWVVRLGRVGYVARSVVFGLIAMFLVLATLRHNPAEAKGLDAVLTELASHAYGTWLLTLVAGGLVVYGVFALVQSRYRRIGER